MQKMKIYRVVKKSKQVTSGSLDNKDDTKAGKKQ